jgi:hypothetical protein
VKKKEAALGKTNTASRGVFLSGFELLDASDIKRLSKIKKYLFMFDVIPEPIP